MPKYKCINPECTYFNRIIDVHSTRIIIENGKAVDKSARCFSCDDTRELIREPGMTTMIAGTNDQELRKKRE